MVKQMKKKVYDIIFIVVSAIILILLFEFKVMPKSMGFALIPLLIAYYFGKYVGKRTQQI